MLVWGVTPEQVTEAVEHISVRYFRGNVKIASGPERTGKTDRSPVTFTLRVHDSRSPGARRSGSGRRTVAACWHAHRGILWRLFYRHGATRVKSLVADYRGAHNFRVSHGDTYYHNAGSRIHPVPFGSLCACAGSSEVRGSEVADAGIR